MDYQEAYDSALAALRAERASEALPLLQTCLELQPDSADAWLYLGVAKGMSGDHDGAQTALDRALQLAPDDARVLYNLARLEQRRGRTELAVDTYRRVLAIDPMHARARQALADLGRAVVSFGAAAPERPVLTTLDGSWRLKGLDATTVAVATVTIWLTGLLMGAMQFVAGRAGHTKELITGAWQTSLMSLVLGPLWAIFAVLVYNLLATRMGPIRARLAIDGEWTVVRRVDERALAGLYAAYTAIAMVVAALIVVPVMAVVMANAPGELGGGGAIFALVIGMLIGMVGGGAFAMAVAYVVALLLGGFYNRLVPRLGGISLAAELDADSVCVVRGVRLMPTVLTVFATAAPWLVVITVMVVGCLWLSFSMSPQAPAHPHFFLAMQAAEMWVGMLGRLVVAALAVRWCGGIKLTVEPDEREW